MLKKSMQGGFTIETALLMPMILTVIMLIVYLNIYLYNVAVMQTIACRGTQKVFYYEREDDDVIEGKCANLVIGALKETLVGMKDVDVEVKVSANEVNIKIKGCLNVPELIYLESLELEDFWTMEAEWTSKRLHAPTLVKSVYHTLMLIKKLDGIEEAEVDMNVELPLLDGNK